MSRLYTLGDCGVHSFAFMTGTLIFAMPSPFVFVVMSTTLLPLLSFNKNVTLSLALPPAIFVLIMATYVPWSRDFVLKVVCHVSIYLLPVTTSFTGRYNPAPGYQRELSSRLLRCTSISFSPGFTKDVISKRKALYPYFHSPAFCPFT